MSESLSIETTLFFAATFGVMHVFFTLRVGGYRMRSKISLGDGGDNELRNRIRAHGNFIENVPIALLLMLLNDLAGIRDYSHNIGINPAGIATRALRHDRLATIPNHSAPAFHVGDLGDHISQCVTAATSSWVNQISAGGLHPTNLDAI